MKSKTVYFNKLRITNAGTVSLIGTSEPVASNDATECLGLTLHSRSQSNSLFGVLSLTDETTGKSLSKDSPFVKKIVATYSQNTLLPGFVMTDKAILDKEGNETGLYWIAKG